MSDRTFRVSDPLLEGTDIRDWQGWLNDKARSWDANMGLGEDGVYGVQTRSCTASVAYGISASNGRRSPAAHEISIVPNSAYQAATARASSGVSGHSQCAPSATGS